MTPNDTHNRLAVTPTEWLRAWKERQRVADPDLDDGLEYMADPVFVNATARDDYGMEWEG